MDPVVLLRDAFVAALRQRTPGSFAAVREAARRHHEHRQPFRGEFALPNGWRVLYHVTAAAATFEVPGICKPGTDTVTAVHLTASALIRVALVEGDISEGLVREYEARRGEYPDEGWTDLEHARMACADYGCWVPDYVKEAMARHLVARAAIAGEAACPRS